MTVRNAEKMQDALMQAAFEEIYARGFQAASLNEIIRKANATKGSMYHHFASKTELGYAVIEKIIQPKLKELWLDPLYKYENPIDGLVDCLNNLTCNLSQEAMQYGCPLGNLVHEMSSVDEGFRVRLNGLMSNWKSELSKLLAKGVENNLIRKDVDPVGVGCFVVASIEGAIGMTKNSQDVDIYKRCNEQLIYYLNSLRA